MTDGWLCPAQDDQNVFERTMKTTLRMLVTARACQSCSTISPAVRSPLRPMVPVAQKVHPIWQPTSEDTHSVARCWPVPLSDAPSSCPRAAPTPCRWRQAAC